MVIDKRVIPRQLLQSLRDPLLAYLIIMPFAYTSGIFPEIKITANKTIRNQIIENITVEFSQYTYPVNFIV